MVVIGILWIPVIQGMQGAQLFFYIQAISAYLAPPIACVYLLAVLWPRANERVTMFYLVEFTGFVVSWADKPRENTCLIFCSLNVIIMITVITATLPIMVAFFFSTRVICPNCLI